MAVVGAERSMQLLPVGTHDWTKFVTPGEAALACGGHGMVLPALRRRNCAKHVSMSQLRACDEESCTSLQQLLPCSSAGFLKTSSGVWAWWLCFMQGHAPPWLLSHHALQGSLTCCWSPIACNCSSWLAWCSSQCQAAGSCKKTLL